MEFSAQYHFKRPIHHVIFSGEFFVGVDNETGFVYYDRQLNKLTTVQKFANPIPHPYHRATGSSANGKLALFYLYAKKGTYLLMYSEEKKRYVLVRELAWSKVELECSAFDNQNRLMATGDNEGKVQVYSCKNGKLYLSLPRRSDYIATMAFNGDGNILAYAAFDKSVTVYDLHRNKALYIGTGQSDAVIMGLRFLHHSNTMVLAGRDGKVTLYDFFKKKVLRTLMMCPAWPMSIYVEENDRYVIVADRGGSVHLVNLQDEDSSSVVLHKAPGAVLDIRNFGNSLYFVCETGEMQAVDMHEAKSALYQAFEAGEYKRCYALINENPLLYFAGVKKKLDEVFDELIKEAITLITAGDLAKAKTNLAPFEADEKHAKKINQTIRIAKKIHEFAQMVRRGELDKAYKTADTESFYKELPVYEKMEKEFKENFEKASLLLTTSPPDNPGARELLKPYMTISHKGGLIKNLFASPVPFSRALLLFKQKEYALLQKFFEKYPVLKDSPVCQEYNDYVSNLEFFFEFNMEMQEYKEALESVVVIEKYFPNMALRMKEDIARLKVIISFIHAVEEDAYLVAMGLASRNEFLIELPEYRKLDRFLNQRFDAAVAYARQGNYEKMVKILAPFVKNKNLQSRALSIYKLYYIEQIVADKSKLDNAAWETLFANYCHWFGVDDELHEIAASVGLIELVEEYDKKGCGPFDPKIFQEVIYQPEEE